jgi:hypothetical protein
MLNYYILLYLKNYETSYYIALREAIEHTWKSKSKLLEFIIKWLLRY